MERVKERLDDALKAIATFEKIVGLKEPTDIERDAAIQRFEYSFEMAWKAAQAYLTNQGLTNIVSPRSAIRASFTVGMFNEETAEKIMRLVDDRNLTSHTYR